MKSKLDRFDMTLLAFIRFFPTFDTCSCGNIFDLFKKCVINQNSVFHTDSVQLKVLQHTVEISVNNTHLQKCFLKGAVIDYNSFNFPSNSVNIPLYLYI